MKAEKIGDGMVVVEGIRYVNENRPRVLTYMEHEEYKKTLRQGQSLPIDNVVRSCYWCENLITDKDTIEELPDNRGNAHSKCDEEFYSSQMDED